MVFPKFDDEEVVETSESKPQDNVDLSQETVDTTDATSTPNYTGTPIPVPRIQEIKNNYLQNPQRRGQREVSPSMTEGVENYDKYLRNPATGKPFTQREYNAARQDGWQIPEKEEDIGHFVDDILRSAEELDPELVAKMIHNPRSTWRMIDEMGLPDDVADKAERLAKKLFAYNDIKGANPNWNIPDISLGYPMPKPKKPKTTNADVSIKLDPNGGSSEHKIFFADHQTAFDGLVAYKKLSKKGQAEAQRTAYDLINEVKKKINGRHENFVVAPKNISDWNKVHRDMIISIMNNADQMIATARTPAEKNMANAVKSILDSYFKREYVRARMYRYRTTHESDYKNALAKAKNGEKEIYQRVRQRLIKNRSIEKILNNAFTILSDNANTDDDNLVKNTVDNIINPPPKRLRIKAGDDKIVREEMENIRTSDPENEEKKKIKRKSQQRMVGVGQSFRDSFKEAMMDRREEGKKYEANPKGKDVFPPRMPITIMIYNATKDMDPEKRKEIDNFLRIYNRKLNKDRFDKSPNAINDLREAIYKLGNERYGKPMIQKQWNEMIGSLPGLPTYDMLQYYPELFGYDPNTGKKMENIENVREPTSLWSDISKTDNFVKDVLTLDDKFPAARITPDKMAKVLSMLKNPSGFNSEKRRKSKVAAILYLLKLDNGIQEQTFVENLVKRAAENPTYDGFIQYILDNELADILRTKNPKRYGNLTQNPSWGE